MTYYFAEDLRVGSTDRPYTVLIDAYEAIASSDQYWVQDLAAQLDRGLAVVASREPIRWGDEWDDAVRYA